MSDSKGVNRKYKYRLFTFIFRNADNKDWTLSLYAVNGSATNPDDIILSTIDDVIYMGMMNDISFLMLNTYVNRIIKKIKYSYIILGGITFEKTNDTLYYFRYVNIFSYGMLGFQS